MRDSVCVAALTSGVVLLAGCQSMQAPAPANAQPAQVQNIKAPPPAPTPAPAPQTAAAPPTAAPPASPATPLNPAAKEKYANLTPLTEYADEWKKAPGDGADFSGTYTKIVVTGDIATVPGDKSYDANPATSSLLYEPRNWFVRSIVGRDFSINLTAKVTIGSYEATIPLATVGHQSNSDGEQWTRMIHHDASSFPLFLVKANGSASVPQMVVSVKAANTYASRGAAAAVGVAVQVAHAVSATPSVVTKLTADSTTKSAQAVDAAISKLFSSGITEEHSTDRDLRLWSGKDANPSGVLVTFRIPTSETNYNSSALTVGTWRITFDFPRPSIFSDWRACPGKDLLRQRCAPTIKEARDFASKELVPSDVLNYKLVTGSNDLGTVRAFLTSQDWYTTAVAAFASNDQKVVTAAATPFCRRIVNEVGALGLNSFDSNAVLWATYRAMPVVFPDFSQMTDCKDKISAFPS